MSSTPHPQSAGPGQPGVHPSVRYEARDVNVKAIAIALAILVLLIVAPLIVLWPVYGYLSSLSTGVTPPAALSLMKERSGPPEPRLQGGPFHQMPPQVELLQMRAEADARLNSYGWVDRPCAVVHIPIQEAMRLLVENGSARSSPPAPNKNCGAASAPAGGAGSGTRRPGQ